MNRHEMRSYGYMALAVAAGVLMAGVSIQMWQLILAGLR